MLHRPFPAPGPYFTSMYLKPSCVWQRQFLSSILAADKLYALWKCFSDISKSQYPHTDWNVYLWKGPHSYSFLLLFYKFFFCCFWLQFKIINSSKKLILDEYGFIAKYWICCLCTSSRITYLMKHSKICLISSHRHDVFDYLNILVCWSKLKKKYNNRTVYLTKNTIRTWWWWSELWNKVLCFYKPAMITCRSLDKRSYCSSRSNLPFDTHIICQTVSLIGYSEPGQLPQAQLALHGFVCAHNEWLPWGGAEGQRLNWGKEELNKYTNTGLDS